MTIKISPLQLTLDPQNPRFVILTNRTQAEIRKYLAMYEDVCQLAAAINDYGSLLPGERIVALYENDHYVVIEGNRRTCCLQMLLNRELIPDGFRHKIPHTSESLKDSCAEIEVDVLQNREEALGLMTKRHIEGVKEWRPLAKKQFFAASYNDGKGQSIQNLSRITGIKQSEIKEDVRDYKFFYSVFSRYSSNHPDFNREIIDLKTDPFWRIFKTKFEYPEGNQVTPKEFLYIDTDEIFNTISSLPSDLFEQIILLVFEKTIVEETITTRNKLTDVEGIEPLLKQALEFEPTKTATAKSTEEKEETPDKQRGEDGKTEEASPVETSEERKGLDTPERPEAKREPGGPSPNAFFEAISWKGKLDENNPDHQGLLVAIDELFKLSTIQYGRQKAYKTFPVGTGMVLRTVYEQALRLRLKQAGLWGAYIQHINDRLPMLSSMEEYIGRNKQAVLVKQEYILAFDRVIAAAHRDFLNANIHYPGNIRVSPDSLEAIAVGGMCSLIQGIIDLI